MKNIPLNKITVAITRLNDIRIEMLTIIEEIVKDRDILFDTNFTAWQKVGSFAAKVIATAGTPFGLLFGVASLQSCHGAAAIAAALNFFGAGFGMAIGGIVLVGIGVAAGFFTHAVLEAMGDTEKQELKRRYIEDIYTLRDALLNWGHVFVPEVTDGNASVLLERHLVSLLGVVKDTRAIDRQAKALLGEKYATLTELLSECADSLDDTYRSNITTLLLEVGCEASIDVPCTTAAIEELSCLYCNRDMRAAIRYLVRNDNIKQACELIAVERDRLMGRLNLLN